jgi:hypothetical protein
VTLQKYFSCPKFYFFPTPPIKLKLVLLRGGETTNSNPAGPVLMTGKSENREQQSDHIYYTLLWQVSGFAVPFTSLSKLCKNAGPKPFCRAKPTCLNFSSSNFNLQVTY